jgi:putative ABC transport system permease protein
MSPLPQGVRGAFRLALRRPPIAQDVDDEVAFHLEMRVAELAAQGWTEDAARTEALRRFGDRQHWSTVMTAVDQERVASQQRAEWLDDLRQDLRFAMRSFRRAPLFSALALLTLALGIGANAAVFGVVKSVLLNPLPYADADRVVRVYGRMRDGSIERAPTSAGLVMDLRERQRSFAGLAAFVDYRENGVYTAGGESELVRLVRTEPELFSVLAATPALGRTLVPDDAAADTAFNIVLTHDGWQRLLGGDARAIGQKVDVNGIRRVVVGVLRPDFVGPLSDVDVYLPVSIRPMMRTVIDGRLRKSLGVMARLKPGVTVDAANAEVLAVADDVARRFPRETGNFTVALMPVREALAGETRTPLLLLMASAGLVLLIACANLAGALLSRTITRRREFAIRVALGAGRGRLMRQLLTESTLLALAGGLVGIALAWGGLAIARGLAAHALPAYASLALDPGALLATAAIAIVTGLAFGAAPALSVGRVDAHAALREETRGASESRRSRGLRGVLVAGQIALCVSLLAGAGLLARSLIAMTSSPLGFDTDGLLTASVHLPRQRYPGGEQRARFMVQFEERLRAIPGIVSVASANEVPTRVVSRNGFTVIGAPPVAAEAQPVALYMDVSDSYFRTMDIPIRSGRAFTAEERLGSPLSVIVTQAMERQYWPNGKAVGSRILLGPPGPDSPEFTVVGVAGDVRNDPARAESQPVLYLSNRQFPWNGPVFLIRGTGDASALVAPVRRALAAIDPAAPLYGVETMQDVVSEGFAGQRLPTVLMTAFGALALVLATVGVYAMFAAMAAAREREFAVRMALGSSRRAIAGLVLSQGGLWMALGLVAGAFGVVAVSRSLAAMLYGVEPFDPVTIAIAGLLLVLCGAIALLVPVRRATRADPVSILR